MEELKGTRKRRQFYWAGLIEDLGDDEWGNPANYDRQRWEDEERKADDKFEELAGQIKLVEMGFPVGLMESQEPGRSGSAGRDRVRTDPSNGPRGSSNRDERGRDGIQNRRQQRALLHQLDHNGRLHANFRGNNPNAPTKRPMVWTKQKQASAVDQWMEEMGMPTSYQNPDHLEHGVVVGGSSASGEDGAVNDAESQLEHIFGGPQTLSTPQGSSGGSSKHRGGATDYRLLTRPNVQPQWTAFDEMAFEEAEREREDERLVLGLDLMKNQEMRAAEEGDRQSVLQPRRAVTLNKDLGDGVPPRQTAPPTGDMDVMSALMRSLDEGRPRIQVQTPSKALKHSFQNVENHIANDRISDITPKVVSIPRASKRTKIEHQLRWRPTAADFMDIEVDTIETVDMQNVVSSDGSENSTHEDPHMGADGEDGFLRLDDTPPPSSPLNRKGPVTAVRTNSAPPAQTVKHFSALGLHYRKALKVNEMFSPTGDLLPPGPDSVATRLRKLRGSFRGYSDKIRQWAADKKNGFDVGNTPESVSACVDARIWVIDWRTRLDMWTEGMCV